MNPGLEKLRGVEPRQVAVWLRARGWERAATQAQREARWRKPAGSEGDYEVELPLDVSFRDYARRMAEVLDTLAVASNLSRAQVLAEICATTSDVIRLRVTGPSVGRGQVPVELGARLFGLTRELLLAAACSAYEPRALYRARKPTEAMEFLKRVKLAPPEEGSFVVTVHAPVAPALQQALQEGLEQDPFERRATLMLASATLAARQAAEAAGLEGDARTFFEGTGRGLSANLCEALAGFVDGEDTTRLELSFGWAASRRVADDTPRRVQFSSDLSPLLQEGARLLRASWASPDFELLGAVVQLTRETPEGGGVVVVAGQVDGRPRKIRVPMEANDYALAIRAHEQGQLLSCEGELVRQGRGLQLERVRHLTLVDDE